MRAILAFFLFLALAIGLVTYLDNRLGCFEATSASLCQ